MPYLVVNLLFSAYAAEIRFQKVRAVVQNRTVSCVSPIRSVFLFLPNLQLFCLHLLRRLRSDVKMKAIDLANSR